MAGPHAYTGHTDRRKSPKIAPPAAAVVFGRARGGQVSSKIAELLKKASPAADL
jgi:hypothetical protein